MESILQQLKARDGLAMKESDYNEAVSLSAVSSKLLNDISSLESEKSKLSEQIQQLTVKGVVPPANVNIDELRAAPLEKYREKDAIQSQINTIDQSIHQYEERKAAILKETGDLNSEEAKLKDETAELHVSRNTIEGQLDSINKELSTASEQTAELQKKTDILHNEIQIFKKRILDSKAFIKSSETSSQHRPLDRLLISIPAHSSSISAITFGTHYESFFTTGDDKRVIHWGLPGLKEISSATLKSTQNNIRLQDEGNLLAMSGSDKTLRILDVSTFRVISELKNHTEACTDTQWISSNQLVSSSKDRTVKLFDLNKNSVTLTIMATSAVFSICPTNNPAVFAAGCYDGSIRLLDTRLKNVTNRVEGVHSKQITSLIWNPTSDSIISLGMDNCLCETSIEVGRRMSSRSDPRLDIKNPFSRLSISPSHGFVCAGSSNGSVLLFDLLQPERVVQLAKQGSPVNCSAYAGNLLITGDSNHTLSFWA